MINKLIADILYEIADLLEIQDILFKPHAYRRAARMVESYSSDLRIVYKEGGKKAIDAIPGVGESITEKIEEIIRSGKLKYLVDLRKKVPIKRGVLRVEGIGPKTAKVLYKKLGVKSLKDLEAAARKGKIKRLAGMGKRTEEEILKNIGFAKKKGGRMRIDSAMRNAKHIIDDLKRARVVTRIEIAGSLRRQKETIGDVDLLCTSKNPKATADAFTKFDYVKRVMAKGRTKSSIRLDDGTNVDLRIVSPASFGAAMQYFTGSKGHNIATRKIAIKKGFKLNEYGLFRGSRQVCGKTEQEIYRKLGLQYIPPELREMQGEFDVAAKKKIPTLIERSDIKGDLQMHSTHSDGTASIVEMARAAKKLGHKYICMTDHAGILQIAHAMKGPQLAAYQKAVRKANRQVSGIHIFCGAEVDIDKDGKLAIADKYLKRLDIVLGSIHTGFRGARAKMTTRIIAAMENEHVDIIAHPSGREINKRQGYELNWQKIFDAAKRTETLLEINAHPRRLDLNGARIKEAIEAGCMLSMGTDAHSPDTLRFIDFGVGQARRGWAQKKDVINTRSVKQIEKFFGI